ncbi:hypothetical protein [Chitinimonas sp. BJYL2]|uniref:hypothetical protein n=1 Tax=Chitinimonas sp. BJYL2 TaxID=2976696 RepID=UPI0022B43DEC|nr:hypothetical protein [Chitinimonas sp. BJYL2]
MRPTDRLDHFLPIRYRNGTLVRQFSKPCEQCGHVLHARDMHGIARLLDDHLGIAATAHCPVCHHQFGIACAVDNQKHVRRVTLPVAFFKFYLRILPQHPAEAAAHEAGLAEVAAERAAHPEASPAAPSVDYERAEAVLGRYQDKPIPAYIVVEGTEVPFDRIEPDGRVGQGEYLLDGCLVYKPA